jgi:predicted dehydrogenase
MARSDWGIGVAGLGGIAQHHIEGYRRQGLTVVAGAEPDENRRNATRKRFGIPHVYATVAEMCERDDVRIVDVAVPHLLDIKRPVFETAARAGKALFAQKPLMPTYADAEALVRIAEDAGTPLMVNQNSVFAPGFRIAYDLLRTSRSIGSPYYCQIENRNWFDLSGHSWFGKSPRWITSDMGVHHYALLHHWFGRAESVFALMRRDPTQTGIVGENVSMLAIRYKNGVEAVVINNWAYRGDAVKPHSVEEVVVQGDGGTLTATSVSVEVVAKDGSKESHALTEQWFPDAFGYAMAHFVDALDAGKPFWCEGRDNLNVIALIEAAYRSVADRRVVALDEIV